MNELIPNQTDDLANGDLCSKIAYNWARKSFNHYPGLMEAGTKTHGSYANIIDLGAGVKIGITSDGIGTKIEIAERMSKYDTLGFDLVAMVVDDLVATGIAPIAISNVLDVDRLNPSIVDILMSGLYEASKVARVMIVGGECAELGNRIGGYEDGKSSPTMRFNWSATAIGKATDTTNSSSLTFGSKVIAGDVIIALAEDGFRSNGFTKIRNILDQHYPENWINEWGEILLKPSIIYAPLIVDILNNPGTTNSIKGIAHITGGGIPYKFARVLASANKYANEEDRKFTSNHVENSKAPKTKLAARLDNLFIPNSMVTSLQKMGNVSSYQAYRHWNMGQGMLLVVAAEDAVQVLNYINENKLNGSARISVPASTEPSFLSYRHNYRAQVAGVVTREDADKATINIVVPTTGEVLKYAY